MGKVRVQMFGSYEYMSDPVGRLERSFSAQEHGHAAAVAKAIEWLSGEVMPRAIELDHDLHGQDKSPDGHWGR